MLYWFLLYNNMNQKYTYIPYLLGHPPTPPFHYSRLSQIIRLRNFPLAIYFTYGKVGTKVIAVLDHEL